MIFRKAMASAKVMASLVVGMVLLSGCDRFDDFDDVFPGKGGSKGNDIKIYTVELNPLNNSGVTGIAKVMVNEDGKFEVITHATDLAPNMVHPQHIHGFVMEDKNAVCPDMSAAGSDGLLTLSDGLPFYGPIIVPLDDMLVPLSAGDFPMANAAGVLNYAEKVSTSSLVSAFDAAYNGTQTMEDLDLDKRVIVLHGAYVKNNMVVPAGTEGAEYMATLPVACGEITELK